MKRKEFNTPISFSKKVMIMFIYSVEESKRLDNKFNKVYKVNKSLNSKRNKKSENSRRKELIEN